MKSDRITFRPQGEFLAMLPFGTTADIRIAMIQDSGHEPSTVILCVATDSRPLMITVSNGKKASVIELTPEGALIHHDVPQSSAQFQH